MFVLLFHEKWAWNKRTNMRKNPRKFDLLAKIGGYFFSHKNFCRKFLCPTFFWGNVLRDLIFLDLVFLHFYLFFLIFTRKFFGNFCSLTKIFQFLMFLEFVCSKKFKALFNIKEHVLLFHDFGWNMFFLEFVPCSKKEYSILLYAFRGPRYNL